MTRWWRPSLTRRVVFALLTAFALVWVVLLAKDYHDAVEDSAHLETTQGAAEAIAAVLEGRDAASARLIVEVDERQYNALRKRESMHQSLPELGDLLFQLEALDHSVAYASAGLRGAPVDVPPSRPGLMTVQGKVYWAASHQTSAGRLTVLEPRLAGPELLVWIAMQELPSLLIAFPVVLLPLWLAVRSGLSPLRGLVARVTARAPDDFSPLGMDLPHAELQPLVHALDDLLAKSRAGIARERAMVQDAAHELRTPLAVVAAQAHALANASHPGAQQQAKLALEAAVQRASHLVHQLLTLARLEGSDIERRQSSDLVAVSRQILIAAAPLADQRGIEVAFESSDRLEATLDLTAFHSVLENLLRNALTYGHPHGHVVVALGATAQRGLVLSVADDGPGIAPEDQGKLFDRFHRGRHVNTPGAGLGLAIVRQAVERMRGHIEVGAGLQGRGVAFVVSIGTVRDADP